MILYFLDPVLKAPTLGCISMCLVCSLVGVFIFIRKETLLGETLSHAAYPGIMFGALLSLLPSLKFPLIACILLGAALFGFLALKGMQFARSSLKMHSDSALCFVLTGFFGLGLTLASLLQNTQSRIYKQAIVFLFGQAATITDPYMYLSMGLAILVLGALVIFYRELHITLFDPLFAKTVGIRTAFIQTLIQILMVGSIVVGIRSIGLFLLSGMFIAPVIAARQWTHKFHRLLILSGLIGGLSGFLGIFSSVELGHYFETKGLSLSFPTGPMIILTSSLFSVFSLLFAPKRGWVARYLKILRFKFKRIQENILKTLWHLSQESDSQGAPLQKVREYQGIPYLCFVFFAYYLKLKGSLAFQNNHLALTFLGRQKAEKIVRFHRLWEVYLVHLGVGMEKIHHNAEEMEHIITPHIEKTLLKLMKDPKRDPHNQPIPNPTKREGSC